MTDVLGLCLPWDERRRAWSGRSTGPAVTIPLADIVTGKPVPPRASVRQRVSARDAERHALPLWPAVERRSARRVGAAHRPGAGRAAAQAGQLVPRVRRPGAARCPRPPTRVRAFYARRGSDVAGAGRARARRRTSRSPTSAGRRSRAVTRRFLRHLASPWRWGAGSRTTTRSSSRRTARACCADGCVDGGEVGTRAGPPSTATGSGCTGCTSYRSTAARATAWR